MSELKTDAIQFCIENADWTSDSSVIDAPKELAALLAGIERLRGECKKAEKRGYELAKSNYGYIQYAECRENMQAVIVKRDVTYEEAKKTQERFEKL